MTNSARAGQKTKKYIYKNKKKENLLKRYNRTSVTIIPRAYYCPAAQHCNSHDGGGGASLAQHTHTRADRKTTTVTHIAVRTAAVHFILAAALASLAADK